MKIKTVLATVLSVVTVLVATHAASASAPGAVSESPSNLRVIVVPDVGLSGVSCGSDSLCVAVGGQSAMPVVVPIRHGTPGAIEVVPGAESNSGLQAVSCPTGSSCVAVGEAPFEIPPERYGTAGMFVAIASGVPTGAGYIQGNGQIGVLDDLYLYGVGCTTPTSCLAAGRDLYLDGVVVPIGPDGFGPQLQSVDNYEMQGATCVAKNYCIVTGASYGSGPTNTGIAFSRKVGVQRGGGYWSAGSDLAASACHHDTLESCLIVGTSTYGGRGILFPIVNLKSGATQYANGSSYLDSIACAGPTYCVAAGSNSSGEGVLVPIIGNRISGHAISVAGVGSLESVSCSGDLSCVAVGGGVSGSSAIVEFSLPLR